jgi:uncharacterized membrane protein
MSDDRRARAEADETDSRADADPDMGDLYDELAELEGLVDSPEERQQVREAIELASEVRAGSALGRIVHGFDVSDVAEAVLGSLLFGIPMFVEGGTEEVGRFIAARPPFLAFTLAVGVALVISILYVADIQDVRVRNPYFGLIPRKFAGVVTVAFLTAVVMMTAWGRVDWAEPWLAFSQIAVAFVPMAIGAALGDILPG